eukprot:3940753-Rhodomonas_salina.4
MLLPTMYPDLAHFVRTHSATIVPEISAKNTAFDASLAQNARSRVPSAMTKVWGLQGGSGR